MSNAMTSALSRTASRRPQAAVIPTHDPHLSMREWQQVQQALRTMARHDGPCGERPGPLRRGLSRVSHLVPGLRHRPLAPVPDELVPLRDFLCESERHGPLLEEKAHALEEQGYSVAQIAAMALIAG